MRIIAGSSRGRPLRAPDGRSTRPTSDRVREAVFDMLTSRGCFEQAEGSGEGPAVVDLFAGSGALGIEALSRGSRSAIFVDSDPRAVATIISNLVSAGLAESGPPARAAAGRASTRLGRARVERADVGRWVAGPGVTDLASADLVFADPPYSFDGWPALLATVAASGFTGLAILEVGDAVDPGDGWDVVKSRTYGTTVVQLVRPAVLAGLPIERKGVV
ncbi:MAG: RsmD family RNA methyltransferase [Acidimicrobiaceae bacterium]|nr:RsmD family RNA methyltransferase [Acidimicrobiaceae bacterium]MBO0748094.1 RsmD family RNA methyltransferase [Acidimicrobiaceae bacterium]